MTGASAPVEKADLVVVICTRDRASHVHTTLEALASQTWTGHDVVVIDQSDHLDQRLAGWAERDPRIRMVRDPGTGLSRARNVAWRMLDAEWIVYLDDDCRPEPDWAASLAGVLADADGIDLVSGHVAGGPRPQGGDYLEVTAFEVDAERMRSGRWTKPWEIGFGVCMAVRRSAIEQLGGWDERLGVGSRHGFGAGEDMDFNYRLLRSGGRALATPAVRAHHEQWRSSDDLIPLYRRYMEGWTGFALKHLRTGDVRGGLWLWLLGFRDAVRMLGSGMRRRSGLRLRVALAKFRGLARASVRGAVMRW